MGYVSVLFLTRELDPHNLGHGMLYLSRDKFGGVKVRNPTQKG